MKYLILMGIPLQRVNNLYWISCFRILSSEASLSNCPLVCNKQNMMQCLIATKQNGLKQYMHIYEIILSISQSLNIKGQICLEEKHSLHGCCNNN